MEKEIELLITKIAEKSPMQEKNVQKYAAAMDGLEKEKLSRRIRYFLERGSTYETMAEGYLKFCEYFTEERFYFLENGTYRYHTYEEASVLYNDEEYMNNYMTGLAFAIYLWGIQRDGMRFFRKKCEEDIHSGGRYLEVGPGHGEYLVTAVENMGFDHYLAVDISQTAAKLTHSFVEFALRDRQNLLDKVDVEHKDFFDFTTEEKFDAIVISEVLEHVENPKDFLVQVRKLSKKDTFIYLSTAINSPYPDHLYLFHNKEEVYEMFKETGLKVVDEVVSTIDGISMEKAIRKKYDIMVGFILAPV
ncbi:MAG: class I SAM-dependent methyltransferase [Lachnospiraceae bacterium]|nr:class I SAM-dependent methyltransferase [Lachnospiraceae bacterium]